jgi:TatD DNase family protein
MWWDTHLHLDALGDDGPDLVADAVAVGVTHMVAVGVDPRRPATLVGPASSQHVPGLRVGFAVGLHPQELPAMNDDAVEEALDALDARVDDDRGCTVAVGEVGLDARRGIGTGVGVGDDGDALARQVRVMKRHLAVARRTGLPLVLHGVRRDGAMLQAIDDDVAAHGPLPPCLWHGYSGSRDTMRLAVARGLFISVGFMALDARARRLREAIPDIPVERLVLETDAPPLAPARIVDVAAAVAALRGVSVERLAETTSANAAALFPRLAALSSR